MILPVDMYIKLLNILPNDFTDGNLELDEKLAYLCNGTVFDRTNNYFYKSIVEAILRTFFKNPECAITTFNSMKKVPAQLYDGMNTLIDSYNNNTSRPNIHREEKVEHLQQMNQHHNIGGSISIRNNIMDNIMKFFNIKQPDALHQSADCLFRTLQVKQSTSLRHYSNKHNFILFILRNYINKYQYTPEDKEYTTSCKYYSFDLHAVHPDTSRLIVLFLLREVKKRSKYYRIAFITGQQKNGEDGQQRIIVNEIVINDMDITLLRVGINAAIYVGNCTEVSFPPPINN